MKTETCSKSKKLIKNCYSAMIEVNICCQIITFFHCVRAVNEQLGGISARCSHFWVVATLTTKVQMFLGYIQWIPESRCSKGREPCLKGAVMTIFFLDMTMFLIRAEQTLPEQILQKVRISMFLPFSDYTSIMLCYHATLQHLVWPLLHTLNVWVWIESCRFLHGWLWWVRSPCFS